MTVNLTRPKWCVVVQEGKHHILYFYDTFRQAQKGLYEYDLEYNREVMLTESAIEKYPYAIY